MWDGRLTRDSHDPAAVEHEVVPFELEVAGVRAVVRVNLRAAEDLEGDGEAIFLGASEFSLEL